MLLKALAVALLAMLKDRISASLFVLIMDVPYAMM